MENAEWWSQQGSLEGCKWEEQEAKKAVDRATKFMKDEKYQKAISLLQKAERLFPGVKGLAELMAVAEVCLAAAWEQCTCQARPQSKTPDWYRVLKVDEKADTSVIKKRYRQLALLLHPDKNKHVKAEAAFKLVSEAYACLSDKYKRNLYTLGRSKARCKRCVLTSRMQSPTPSFGYFQEHQQKVSVQQKPQAPAIAKQSPSEWKSDAEKLQMFRERARARVSSLEHAWDARNSKWNARERAKGDRGSIETCREQRSDKADCFSDLRQQLEQMERDSRQGMRDNYNWRALGRQPQSAEGKTGDRTFTNLKEVGRQKRKEKPNVSQSLDDLLNMLRAESSAYGRRGYVCSRVESRNGTKEDAITPRNRDRDITVETGSTSHVDQHGRPTWSPGNGEAPISDSAAAADLHARAIDKFLADLVRSVDRAAMEEVPEEEGILEDHCFQSIDASDKSQQSSARSPSAEFACFTSGTSQWSNKSPGSGDSATESPKDDDIEDWSGSYKQEFEENLASFSEENVCTCSLARGERSQPFGFNPVCSEPNFSDRFEKEGDNLFASNLGECRRREILEDMDTTIEVNTAAAAQSPAMNIPVVQDAGEPVAESPFRFGSFSNLAKEDTTAASISGPTTSGTGRAPETCEFRDGGVSKIRIPSMHAANDGVTSRRVLPPSRSSLYSKHLPARTCDVFDSQAGVRQWESQLCRSPGVHTLGTGRLSEPHGASCPLNGETEIVDAFLQSNESIGFREPSPRSAAGSLHVTQGSERLQESSAEGKIESRQAGKDSWNSYDLDREQTIMREHKEKSDQLLKTLERLREEAKSVAATLDNLRRTVGTDADVGSSSHFVNSCHPAAQSLVA